MAPERIRRFTGTERAIHWTHAAAFLVMLATGMVMYSNGLAAAVGRRDLVKNVHLITALVWVIALTAIVLLGDRCALRRSWHEIEAIDRDDLRWLARRRPSPQGRFNAGQKLNAIVTAAFAVLFLVSGFFLWYGQRDHRFLLDGSGALHDALTFASIALLVGHLYLALVHPSTRHAIRGMTQGDVDLEWATRHHPKWVARERGDNATAAGRSTTDRDHG